MGLALHIVWRKLLLGGLTLVVLAAATLAVARWWRLQHRSDLDRAMAMAPADTEQYSWTAWSDIRDELDFSSTAKSSDVAVLIARAGAADLTSTSTIAADASAIFEATGISPGTAEWELGARTSSAPVLLVRVGDTDPVNAALSKSGYADRGGYWDASRSGLGLDPVFNTVVVVGSSNLVVASSSSQLARRVANNVGGRNTGTAAAAVARSLQGALSAQIYTGPAGCKVTSMDSASATDREAGATLTEAAGATTAPAALGIGALADEEAGDQVVVALGFDDQAEATANLAPRKALATGPAPGWGGEFADYFALSSARASGAVLALDLDPVTGVSLVTRLSGGPVLFAAC